MDTIYALFIFLAVVFIVYQTDRLLNMGLRNRGKQNDEISEIDTGEAQELTPVHLSDPVIAPTKLSNGTTKDEMIHDLAEENARLQAEVDALRKQLVALFDNEDSEPKRFEPGK